ncbi:uncharacterized protein DS421_16g547080 [Arachis hypogaea]|nr:uncharacterized protein DS421_16g547080 [Arachis hypogaea]
MNLLSNHHRRYAMEQSELRLRYWGSHCYRRRILVAAGVAVKLRLCVSDRRSSGLSFCHLRPCFHRRCRHRGFCSRLSLGVIDGAAAGSIWSCGCFVLLIQFEFRCLRVA